MADPRFQKKGFTISDNRVAYMILSKTKRDHEACIQEAFKDFPDVEEFDFTDTAHSDPTAKGQIWWFGVEFVLPNSVFRPLGYRGT